MKFLKGITSEDNFLSMMFVLIVALFNTMTGLFFLRIEHPVDSPTYGRMSEVLDLNIYGLLLIISAAFLIVAIFQHEKPRFISMLIGGILGGLLISFYTSASTLGAPNMILPIRYGLIACGSFIIAAVGGVKFWKNKKKTT